MTAAYSYALRKTDTSKALDYIREAEIILHSDSIRDGSSLYYIYGLLLRQQGRDSEAAECFRQSIDLLKANHNEGDIRSFIEYSDILFKRNRHTEAVAVLDSALMITDSGHSGIFRQDVLKALAVTHRLLGNDVLSRKYFSIAENENNVEDKAGKELIIEHIKSKYDLERADNEVNRQRVELLEKERYHGSEKEHPGEVGDKSVCMALRIGGLLPARIGL
jgi:tetratricopeptide (TPR) repeat protein